MSKRVAITVVSKEGLDAKIDPRFGRAEYFLIVDLPERKIVDLIANGAKDLAHGAGTGSAAVMSDNDVHTVMSGRFGPKAEQGLIKLGIELVLVPSDKTAGEVLDMFEAGTLGQQGSAGGGQGMGGGGQGMSGGGQGMGGGGQGKGGGGGQGMGGGGRGMGGGGGRGMGGGGRGMGGGGKGMGGGGGTN